MSNEFWKNKSLSGMNREEWESLCDGCALCCLQKLQDDESGEVYYTDIACKQLDTESCRCINYAERARLVASCLTLSADDPATFAWLPASCAYKRLANGEGLPDWHPLVTGDGNSVHEAGISARGKTVSERDTSDYRVLRKLQP